MIAAETALELAARSLEGEAIAGVVHVEPELAVVLELASGRRVEVRWADELGLRHGFGVALRDVAVVDGARGELVDATRRWGDRVGVPIARATIRWGDAAADLRASMRILVAIHAHHLGRADYPRALDLGFANGRTVSFEVAFLAALTVRLG